MLTPIPIPWYYDYELETILTKEEKMDSLKM